MARPEPDFGAPYIRASRSTGGRGAERGGKTSRKCARPSHCNPSDRGGTSIMARFRFVFLGLSITSSWGNGHATTYRSLLRELAARGHDILFLERDMPWYADNRDL